MNRGADNNPTKIPKYANDVIILRTASRLLSGFSSGVVVRAPEPAANGERRNLFSNDGFVDGV